MVLTRTKTTVWIWNQERIGSFICGAVGETFSFSIFFLLFLITITVWVHNDNSHHYDFSSSQAGERLMVEENSFLALELHRAVNITEQECMKSIYKIYACDGEKVVQGIKC